MNKLTTLTAIAALSAFAAEANAGGYAAHCAAPAPICAPTYLQHSGHYVTQTYSYWTQVPVTVHPVPVQRWSSCGGYSSCNLTLAGPPIKSHDYHRGVTYTEHMPVARATREVVRGDCPTGTTYQADGTCLQAGVISGSSYSGSSYSYSGSRHSGGTVWTGGSEHFNERTGKYDHGWRHRKHKSCKSATSCDSEFTTTVYGGKSHCDSRKSDTTYDYEKSSRCN